MRRWNVSPRKVGCKTNRIIIINHIDCDKAGPCPLLTTTAVPLLHMLPDPCKKGLSFITTLEHTRYCIGRGQIAFSEASAVQISKKGPESTTTGLKRAKNIQNIKGITLLTLTLLFCVLVSPITLWWPGDAPYLLGHKPMYSVCAGDRAASRLREIR